MQGGVNMQVGIFTEELCISFRNILQETLEAFIARANTLAADIHATAQDGQAFETRLANGLMSVATWDSELKDRYCAQVASSYPQITELYRYAYLLYLKDMYSRHLNELTVRVSIPSLSTMLNTFLRLACSSPSMQSGEYHSMKYWERVLFVEDMVRRMLYELVVRQNSVKGYINRNAGLGGATPAPMTTSRPPPRLPDMSVQTDGATSHDLVPPTPYQVPTDPSRPPSRPPSQPVWSHAAHQPAPQQPAPYASQATMPQLPPRTHTPGNLTGVVRASAAGAASAVGSAAGSGLAGSQGAASAGPAPPTPHTTPSAAGQGSGASAPPAFSFYGAIPAAATKHTGRHSIPLPRVPQQPAAAPSQTSNLSRVSEATSNGAPPAGSVTSVPKPSSVGGPPSMPGGLPQRAPAPPQVDPSKFTARRPTGSSLPDPHGAPGVTHAIDDHDLAPSEQDYEGEVRRVLDNATTGTIMPHDSVSNIGGGGGGVMGPPPRVF